MTQRPTSIDDDFENFAGFDKELDAELKRYETPRQSEPDWMEQGSKGPGLDTQGIKDDIHNIGNHGFIKRGHGNTEQGQSFRDDLSKTVDDMKRGELPTPQTAGDRKIKDIQKTLGLLY